jgi:hypothetical protein
MMNDLPKEHRFAFVQNCKQQEQQASLQDELHHQGQVKDLMSA